MMMKYFHGGINESILFKSWQTDNVGSFIGSWFAVLAFSIFYEFFKTSRCILELKWNIKNNNDIETKQQSQSDYEGNEKNNNNNNNLISSNFLNGYYPTFSYKDLIRGLFHGIEMAISLILMLIVMSYNIALFFAVIIGVIIGYILFGRFRQYKPKVSCC